MSNILRRLNYIEPARVRAVWTAVVMLLASAGVAVSTDLIPLCRCRRSGEGDARGSPQPPKQKHIHLI